MDYSDFFSRTATQQLDIMNQVADQALTLWNMSDASIELIKFRENAVYKVESATGIKSALRVHRLGYHNDAELLSEIQWMQGLLEAGIQTPDFIPSWNGELVRRVNIDGVSAPFQVDMLAWAEGQPLGSIEEGISEDEAELAAVFHQIGVIAARSHNWAENWQQPEGFTRHAWDVEGLVGEAPFWGRFWESEALSSDQRSLLEAARGKLRKDLEAFGTGSDRYGLIHADFLPENFLVGEDGMRLIDFDDAGYGWHLFDLATPLFFHQGEPHFEAIKEALIAGYRSERELPDEHVAMLPTLLFARGTTNVGWLHTRDLPDEMLAMVPVVIEMVCGMAEVYLAGSSNE